MTLSKLCTHFPPDIHYKAWTCFSEWTDGKVNILSSSFRLNLLFHLRYCPLLQLLHRARIIRGAHFEVAYLRTIHIWKAYHYQLAVTSQLSRAFYRRCHSFSVGNRHHFVCFERRSGSST
jgi:hypothetical protein